MVVFLYLFFTDGIPDNSLSNNDTSAEETVGDDNAAEAETDEDNTQTNTEIDPPPVDDPPPVELDEPIPEPEPALFDLEHFAPGDLLPGSSRTKSNVGHTVKIEIEVDTLTQLEEVLREGADIVLLDNMSTDDLKTAVSMAKGKAILEASGNVTVETVRVIAETGVDVISSGWITHSAPTLDLGLDVQ